MTIKNEKSDLFKITHFIWIDNNYRSRDIIRFDVVLKVDIN